MGVEQSKGFPFPGVCKRRNCLLPSPDDPIALKEYIDIHYEFGIRLSSVSIGRSSASAIINSTHEIPPLAYALSLFNIYNELGALKYITKCGLDVVVIYAILRFQCGVTLPVPVVNNILRFTWIQPPTIGQLYLPFPPPHLSLLWDFFKKSEGYKDIADGRIRKLEYFDREQKRKFEPYFDEEELRIPDEDFPEIVYFTGDIQRFRDKRYYRLNPDYQEHFLKRRLLLDKAEKEELAVQEGKYTAVLRDFSIYWY